MILNQLAHPAIHTAHTLRGTTLTSLKAHPNFASTTFITLEQPHRSEIIILEKPKMTRIPHVDAVITDQTGMTLAIKHADCLPILIHHPAGLIAAVHAGRRGTQERILKKTLRKLKTEFGLTTAPQIWFGPALCADCHHTNAEKTEFFDLVRENNTQAEAVYGSDIEILVTDHCTACTPDKYHSYRRDGAGVPMNWSVITLK